MRRHNLFDTAYQLWGRGKALAVALRTTALSALRRLWNRDTALVVALIATALLFEGIWYAAPVLRPFLIPIGAALGTLFAALAGFAPTIQGKLIPAALASALVGLGTWYTTFELDREKNSLQVRLNLMREAFLVYAKDLNEEQRSALVRKLARDDLRKRINDGQADHVTDISDFILQISSDNGHGLYFSGEAWRIRKRREQMRGEFNKYLWVESQLNPEQRSAGDCYQRFNGFCAERTAWIDHMMANDFYRSALANTEGAAKIAALNTACSYLKDSLDHFSGGFPTSESLYGTQYLQERIRNDLIKLGTAQVSVSKDIPGCAIPVKELPPK